MNLEKMETIEYKRKTKEILSKFKPFYIERYRYDPTARAILEVLIRDGDIYDLIEQVLDNNLKLYKKFDLAIKSMNLESRMMYQKLLDKK